MIVDNNNIIIHNIRKVTVGILTGKKLQTTRLVDTYSRAQVETLFSIIKLPCRMTIISKTMPRRVHRRRENI